MKKLILMMLCGLWMANVGAQASNPPEKPKSETHDGLVPVLGFLGGKLLGELKTRFNLESEEDTLPKVKTPVHLNIAGFKVETSENRTVSKN
jgi:hypothetical protein